jgi:hypothetical protein
MVRRKVGEHKLPIKNLRGHIVAEAYNGWTDEQTLVITNLTQKKPKDTTKQDNNC